MEIYNGTYCVYIHTNKINGKMYVGQTIYGDNPKRRWCNGHGYEGSTYFYNAIQKYGWDNFEHEIIASKLTKEEANNFEKILIKELKTQNKKYGYNICDGGQTNNSMKGRKLSEETKQKMRETKIGEKNPMYGVGLYGEKNGMYGKHLSDEAREKLRQKFSGEGNPNYGKPMSEEQKKKISESRKGKYAGENAPMYGKTHSEDTCKKLSEAHRGAKAFNAKPVVQLDDDGNLIKEWSCMVDAWQTLGICRMSIPHCLAGKQKHAGGYCWMSATEYYEQLNTNNTK